MIAALDENLPQCYARMLDPLAKHGGHSVVHVNDLVPRGTPDVKVFSAMKANGVAIHITQDHHQRKRVEVDAIAAYGLLVFVLNKSWASQAFHPKAVQLVRHWPAIAAQAERMRPPATFRVLWNGKFEVIRRI